MVGAGVIIKMSLSIPWVTAKQKSDQRPVSLHLVEARLKNSSVCHPPEWQTEELFSLAGRAAVAAAVGRGLKGT